VVRHAAARRFTVTLNYLSDSVEMSVTDDGRDSMSSRWIDADLPGSGMGYEASASASSARTVS